MTQLSLDCLSFILLSRLSDPKPETETVRRRITNKSCSKQNLLTTLIREEMIYLLFALMSQQKDHIVYQTETHYVKHIGELFDKNHQVLSQFMTLVSKSIPSNTVYSNLLRPLYTIC